MTGTKFLDVGERDWEGLAVLQFFSGVAVYANAELCTAHCQFSKFLGPCCAPIFFLESQFWKVLGPCCAPIFFLESQLSKFGA